LGYQRLQNLVALVAAATHFAAVFLGQKLKLRLLTEKLIIICLRFFGIPPFRFYALADGIRNVLSPSGFLAFTTVPSMPRLKEWGNSSKKRLTMSDGTA
jgi:hypothetical protein